MNLFTSWLKDPQKKDISPNQSTTPQHSQPKPQHTQPQQRPAQTNEQRPSAQQQPPRQQNNNRGQRPNFQRNFRQQRPQFRQNPSHRTNTEPVPPAPMDKLRVITLGGLEEVGKNSIAFEYGDQAIIVDMGLQFPDENMHGIDYAVADYSYFKGKEKNIKALIVTHGHLDHIGGIPHVMPQLGVQIPIYCTEMTGALIKKRQEEMNLRLNVQIVHYEETLRFGPFTVDFFKVNHTIPGSMGVVIGTPVGNIVHTGDWKIDLTPVNDDVVDFAKLAKISENGVLAAFCDSTNAFQPGLQMSEASVKDPLDGLFFKAKGRIIVGIFASNLSRAQQIISLAEQYGRKVVLMGRTMLNNVEIARNLKYMQVAPHTLITIQEANRLRPEQVVVILTGAQGEKNAALLRAAIGEHRFLQIQAGDLVIFSSSVIPGNEQSVGQLMDKLYRKGATAVNYRMMEIHAGGHAKADDTKLLLRILKPKYFVPIEGNHYLLCMHAAIAAKVGYDGKRTIIPDNGTVMEFDAQGAVQVLKQKAPHHLVAIDGGIMGDINESVIEERHVLAQEGMVSVIMTSNRDKPLLHGEPEVITKGFIISHGANALMNEIKTIAKNTFNKHGPQLYSSNINELKGMIQQAIRQHIFNKTQREPMILPIVVQV